MDDVADQENERVVILDRRGTCSKKLLPCGTRGSLFSAEFVVSPQKVGVIISVAFSVIARNVYDVIMSYD